MKREAFMCIVHGVREYDYYFMLKKICTTMVSFSSIQKCTATLRFLVYGAPADTQDDYLHMAESTDLSESTK